MASKGDALISQVSSAYAAAHESTKGPGDARPTALQIIKDNGLEGKLADKVIFITGCSSGIGIETARALVVTGARLFCSTRDMEKGKTALRDILKPGHVELIQLDMNSLDSVRACAADFLSKSPKLNILINNAGVMRTPEGRTADGFETQFGTNHLAHFLLFNLLKPALLAGSSPAFQSRVVNVSSTGHRYAQIHFDNFNLEHGAYDPGLAYGQSKIANVYMANEIETRYGAQGLHGLSLHPGGIWTGLQQFVPESVMSAWSSEAAIQDHMKSPEQGAATTILAAVGKDFEGKGRVYLEECRQGGPVEEGYSLLDPGYETYAFDREKEARLWTESLRMVGLTEES